MEFKHLRLESVTPALGAVVHGVDLDTVAAPAVYAEIKQALWDRQVLFFRKQKLSPGSFRRLGEAFGTPEVHEYFAHVEGFPEIQKVASDGTAAPYTDRWHADVTFRARPSMVEVLRAVELPENGGGDTLWASMGAAFDGLGPALQDCLMQLTAVHDLPWSFRKNPYLNRENTPEEELELIRKHPPARHPVVISHPVTGRATLFVNAIWTKRIETIDPRLSDHLLAMLADWVQKPEFQLRFHWEKDSVAIWDNFATQHYAAFDYAPQPRLMHRMTCGSAAPGAAVRSAPERSAA
jgi:taurine dioxygenase